LVNDINQSFASYAVAVFSPLLSSLFLVGLLVGWLVGLLVGLLSVCQCGLLNCWIGWWSDSDSLTRNSLVRYGTSIRVPLRHRIACLLVLCLSCWRVFQDDIFSALAPQVTDRLALGSLSGGHSKGTTLLLLLLCLCLSPWCFCIFFSCLC
jgi:hypothetical protein